MPLNDDSSYTRDEVTAIVNREVLTHRMDRVEKDLDTHIPALYKDVEEIKNTLAQVDNSIARLGARFTTSATIIVIALGIIQWLIALKVG